MQFPFYYSRHDTIIQHVQKFWTCSRLQAELCRGVPSYAEPCRVVASYPELHEELYASYRECLL